MRLVRLQLEHADGVPVSAEGLRLEGLAPGFNVITGSNGAGKSTLAAAIRTQLWPMTAGPRERTFRLVAVWQDASGAECVVRARAGELDWQPEGVPMPAEHLAECLVLRGADLRVPDQGASPGGRGAESRLAREVRIQLARGVDLEQAWRDSRATPRAGHQQSKKLESARRARADAEQFTQQVAEAEQDLPGLRHKSETLATRGAAAERFAEGLRTVRDLAEACAERFHCADALLAQRQKPKGSVVWDAGAVRAQGAMERLRALGRSWAAADREADGASIAAARAAARAKELRQRVLVDGAPTPDAGDLDRLGAILERWAAYRQDVQAWTQDCRRAEREAQRWPEHDPAELRRGREMLQRWRVAATEAAWHALLPWWVWLLCGAFAVVGIALGVLVAPPWAAFAAGSVGVVAVAYPVQRGRRGWLRRVLVEREWPNLGLPEPESWEPKPVQAAIRRLDASLLDARAAELASAAQSGPLKDREVELEGVRTRLEEDAKALQQWAPGLDPSGDLLTRTVVLRWLTEWSAADADAAEAAGEKALRQGESTAARAAWHDCVMSWVADGEDLDGTDLGLPETGDDAEGWFDEALAVRNGIQRQHDILRAAEKAEQECRRSALAALTACDMAEPLPPWDASGAEASFKDLLSKLQGVHDAAREEAAEAEPLNQQIGAIQERVAKARKDSALADRIQDVEEARDALADVRDEALRKAARRWLCARMEARLEQAEMPDVWARADAWMGEFTNNRYALELHTPGTVADGGTGSQVAGVGGRDGSAVRLMARDTGQGRSMELWELSTGTQAQLLLAVRLAVAGVGESGAPWPLVLDEVLPTTDLERARPIAAALAKVAQQRQVIYFTFHERELALLEEACRDAEIAVPLRHHLGAGSPVPAADLPAPAPEVVSPGSDGPEAYAARLGAHPPDPRSPAAGLHIVHLLWDDLGAAKALLDRSLSTLGAWRQHGARFAGALPQGLAATVNARAVVWEAICTVWQRVCGRRTSPLDLQASGAFKTPAAQLHLATAEERLEAMDWDAGALLREMNNDKELYPKMRTKTKDQLKEHLLSVGCLGQGDPQDPPSAEQLILEVLATPQVADVIASGAAGPADIRTWWATWSRRQG